MSQIKITVQNKSSTADNNFRLDPYCKDRGKVMQRLERMFGEMMEGAAGQSLSIYVDGRDGVKASGTLTLASVVATNTCQVGSQTFTAIASGATGNQFNVGGTDTITATNLAATINANAQLNPVMAAVAVGTVVTVTMSNVGVGGNSIQLIGSTHITASAGYLAGGTEPTANVLSLGGIR